MAQEITQERSSIKESRPLNFKQQRFVEEYLKDCNGTRAAVEAGYSEKTASGIAIQLLRKNHVISAIQSEQKKRRAKSKTSARWVLRRLRIEALGKGPDTKASARVKALETISRILGMQTDKIELTGRDGGAIQIADMSEQERVQRLMQLLSLAEQRLPIKQVDSVIESE